MRTFSPSKRDCLLIPDTGPIDDIERAHLFIALTDPCPQKDILLAPICSVYPKCKKTCVLRPGDHGFIKVESFVDYSNTIRRSVSAVEKLVRNGRIVYKGKIAEEIFKQICEGLSFSLFVTPGVKNYYNKNSKS